jgi:hypothetical protein
MDELGTELKAKINKMLKRSNPSFHTICRKIEEKSAIITIEEQSLALMGMFSKKVKSLELVFSASKNQFSLLKYW